MMCRLFIMFALLLSMSCAYCNDMYPFNSSKQSAQFDNLLHDLRCLVCQNQDLADSNAPLAEDLKREVYRLVKEGQSDTEIIGYLTERYGDFILFRPPVKPITYALWFAPMILTLFGALIFWRTLRKA